MVYVTLLTELPVPFKLLIVPPHSIERLKSIEEQWGLDSITGIREGVTMVGNLCTICGFLSLITMYYLDFFIFSGYSRLFGVESIAKKTCQ